MARSSDGSRPEAGVDYPNLTPALRSLLKDTKTRRVSVSAEDAPDGPYDTQTPYDIINPTQLQRWAEDDPERLFEAFSELRRQRDFGLKVTSLYEALIDEHRLEKVKNVTLRKDLLQAQAHTQSLREDSPFSAQSASGKPTQKLPDPRLFTNGESPTWDDWSSKIADKLEINHDHYGTERAKIAYIMSRLGGEAAEHMYARRKPRSHNPYITADEVLDDLKEIYEDPDKENSYRRQYEALKQGPRKFSEFFRDFRRLSSLLGYGEKQLIHDLNDKIARRLLKAVVGQWIQPTTLNEYKNYLIRLDNEQRAIREQKNKETAAPTSPALVKLSASSNYTTSADRQHQVDERDGDCDTCHRPGHTAKQMPFELTSSSTLRSTFPS